MEEVLITKLNVYFVRSKGKPECLAEPIIDEFETNKPNSFLVVAFMKVKLLSTYPIQLTLAVELLREFDLMFLTNSELSKPNRYWKWSCKRLNPSLSAQ